MVGADVKIAEIHQRVGDGVLIPLRALDREYFPIAGFCVTQVAREGADVAKIAERIGEGAVVIGQAIIRDCLFIGSFGLRELAAVEKNARAMFVSVRHGFVKREARDQTDIPQARYGRRFTRYASPLVSSFRCVVSKLDLNLIFFIEPQSITK